MNFTPEQIQNNLGKYNTEQYEYGKLENTEANRKKVSEQAVDPHTASELMKMIEETNKRLTANEIKDKNQDRVDGKHGEALRSHQILLEKMGEKEKEINSLIQGVETRDEKS